MTLNVASSLEGLARAEEMLAFGRAQIEPQVSKRVRLKHIVRRRGRGEDPT